MDRRGFLKAVVGYGVAAVVGLPLEIVKVTAKVTRPIGSFLGNTRLSKMLREAACPLMKFRQFTEIKEAFDKNKGDVIFFDKVHK